MTDTTLRWPKRAIRALTHLFRPLQDIDVYVEDSGDEVFYNELFSRIKPEKIRFVRVFCVGNRSMVIERAHAYDFSTRPALFIIDGDFEWVRDDPSPDVPGTIRLDAYCIENLLIQESAAVQLVIEDAAVDQEEASKRLDFGAWLSGVSGPLVDLFVWFAVLNRANPTEPTVGLGVGKIITSAKKGRNPVLDLKKIASLRRTVEKKAVDALGNEAIIELHQAISSRVAALNKPHDSVSGKDFLLPLFEHRLWSCTCNKTKRQSLRIRLARHCDTSRFAAVTTALRGSVYLDA